MRPILRTLKKTTGAKNRLYQKKSKTSLTQNSSILSTSKELVRRAGIISRIFVLYFKSACTPVTVESMYESYLMTSLMNQSINDAERRDSESDLQSELQASNDNVSNF
jgi:hypothetical protein